MNNTLTLAVTLALIPSAIAAKGSSSASDSQPVSGFVAIEDAQRVMHFSDSRIWGTVDGVVLVCPFDAEASSREKECTTKAAKYAWVALQSLVVPGHEISGLQFMFAGRSGDRKLLVFWRRKK